MPLISSDRVATVRIVREPYGSDESRTDLMGHMGTVWVVSRLYRSNENCTGRRKKYQLMAKPVLLDGTEPAVFLSEVAKQHDDRASF